MSVDVFWNTDDFLPKKVLQLLTVSNKPDCGLVQNNSVLNDQSGSNVTAHTASLPLRFRISCSDASTISTQIRVKNGWHKK